MNQTTSDSWIRAGSDRDHRFCLQFCAGRGDGCEKLLKQIWKGINDKKNKQGNIWARPDAWYKNSTTSRWKVKVRMTDGQSVSDPAVVWFASKQESLSPIKIQNGVLFQLKLTPCKHNPELQSQWFCATVENMPVEEDMEDEMDEMPVEEEKQSQFVGAELVTKRARLSSEDELEENHYVSGEAFEEAQVAEVKQAETRHASDGGNDCETEHGTVVEAKHSSDEEDEDWAVFDSLYSSEDESNESKRRKSIGPDDGLLSELSNESESSRRAAEELLEFRGREDDCAFPFGFLPGSVKRESSFPIRKKSEEIRSLVNMICSLDSWHAASVFRVDLEESGGSKLGLNHFFGIGMNKDLCLETEHRGPSELSVFQCLQKIVFDVLGDSNNGGFDSDHHTKTFLEKWTAIMSRWVGAEDARDRAVFTLKFMRVMLPKNSGHDGQSLVTLNDLKIAGSGVGNRRIDEDYAYCLLALMMFVSSKETASQLLQAKEQPMMRVLVFIFEVLSKCQNVYTAASGNPGRHAQTFV